MDIGLSAGMAHQRGLSGEGEQKMPIPARLDPAGAWRDKYHKRDTDDFGVFYHMSFLAMGERFEMSKI